jgi:hypothetical protein
MNKNVRTVLISMLAGYVIAGLLSGSGLSNIGHALSGRAVHSVSATRYLKPDRRTAAIARDAVLDRDAEKDEIMWAGMMVEREVLRGKYKRGEVEAIKADFAYFRLVYALSRDAPVT